MSSDVAIYRASVPDRMQYAQALAQSGLLPDAYRNKPANILVALEYGAGLGIPPMTAIQQVHIVQGKPVASSQLIGALVRKAGHRLRVTGDDTRAVCEIVRSDDPDFTFRSEWTIERAQRAKLTGKETWRAYPGNMLRARAITECARDACPEALAGISYTAEELGADELDIESFPQTDGGGHAEPSGETATPPPSLDIVDAVLVDDADTDGAGHPATDDGSRGRPDADHPAPSARPLNDGGDRERRSKRMFAMFRERMPDASKDERLAFTSAAVRRDVASSSELTDGELLTVCDALALLPKPGASS